MKKRTLLVGTIVFIFLLIVYFAVSYAIFRNIADVQPHCDMRKGEAEFTPSNFGSEPHAPPAFSTAPYLMPVYETVTFPSRSPEITISAFYMPAQGVADETNAPTVIVVHGFNDCKSRTFILTAAGMLNKQGFNVLAPDLRDHGESTIEDGLQSAGTKEYLDVLGAFDWLVHTKGIPAHRIGLLGFSLGASTVLIAGAEEPQILAVWEDSGYSDLDKLIQEELELKSIPGIFGSGAIFVGKALTRDNLMAYTPRIEVAKLKGRSLAVVHGDHDTRINVHHGYEIADAAQANGVNITRWITDTEHILSIYYYPQGYERRLVSFFSEALR